MGIYKLVLVSLNDISILSFCSVLNQDCVIDLEYTVRNNKDLKKQCLWMHEQKYRI